ncbi:MAG: NUDIX hydrolase [Promethearchaeota archaeon]
MIENWQLKKREKLGDFRIFEVWGQELLDPRDHRPYTTYQIVTNPWVNVVPLTKSGEVVMVRQFRFGSHEVTLEIPGGLVEDGEDPRGAGVRELFEETGYRPGRTTEIGKVRPNPAIHPNWCYTFLCEDCVPAGGQDLDEREIIEVELVPLDHIPDMIRGGEITHSLVVAAFHYLDLYGESRPFT